MPSQVIGVTGFTCHTPGALVGSAVRICDWGVVMKSRAAVLHGTDQEWRVEEIEVDAPKAGEVLVEWKAAGMCHSDEHMVTGDMVTPREAWPLMGVDELWPVVGGHEGAGVVSAIGPGVRSVAVGDHVSA